MYECNPQTLLWVVRRFEQKKKHSSNDYAMLIIAIFAFKIIFRFRILRNLPLHVFIQYLHVILNRTYRLDQLQRHCGDQRLRSPNIFSQIIRNRPPEHHVIHDDHEEKDQKQNELNRLNRID